MRFYFAPLEGITLAPFRQTHQAFYKGVDRYYTPFLVANQTLHFKNGELRDVDPALNPGIEVIPQVLTNKAAEFVWAVQTLAGMGYREINFNLGCPFPTVTSRGKGSGFLAFPDRLDAFFEEVFDSLKKWEIESDQKEPDQKEPDQKEADQKDPDQKERDQEDQKEPDQKKAGQTKPAQMRPDKKEPGKEEPGKEEPGKKEPDNKGLSDLKISVKTRIGWENPEEIKTLLPIYNRYPISELTVHPRVRTELYSGDVHMDLFGYVLENSIHPVCYNGEIYSVEDYELLKEKFPRLDRVMLGRGLVRDPALAEKIRNSIAGKESPEISGGMRYSDAYLEEYLRALFTRYKEIYPDERHIVSKMKELWYYMKVRYPGHEKAYKKMKKAVTREQYEAAAAEILL